jgi:hypothetical protein
LRIEEERKQESTIPYTSTPVLFWSFALSPSFSLSRTKLIYLISEAGESVIGSQDLKQGKADG